MDIQRYNAKAEGGQFGVIANEPNDVYHANPAISNSDLSLFLSDPKRFEGQRNGTLERPHKAAWDLGDLFHTLVLEDVTVYQAKYVYESLCPIKLTKTQREALDKFPTLEKPTASQVKAHEKNSKIQQTFDAFWKLNEGKRPIKQEDDLRARGMRDSLWSDSDATELLAGFNEAKKELTLRTGMTQFGFPVQVKLDCFFPLAGTVVDLKSVRNLDQFRSNFADFGYYRQAAFYSLVCEHVTGISPEFYFVAVETEAPYEVAVFQAEPQTIEIGIEEIKAGLSSMGQCLRDEFFPKRFSGYNSLELKPWEIERVQARISRIEAGLDARKSA